jgi:tripartite-type tricarboxylate transporter receptor subunit TctC
VVQRVLADSETQRRLAAAYIEPMPLSPAETATALAAEHVRLGRLIQQLGIRADGTG